MTNIEKNCSSCGKPFACHQAAGCWCENIHLDAATRADLRVRFANCLCEDCLRAAATSIPGTGGNVRSIL